MKIKIEMTADGSRTFYREDLDEHYHSVKGAIAESRHVYVESGWRKRAQSKDVVRVFEVGFGSGLNAVLTAEAALESAVPTEYYSVELHPLEASATELFSEGLPRQLRDLFHAVNAAPWGEPIRINPYFTLHKIAADLLAMQLPADIDVIYYDAFAPEKQPEMWNESIFRRLRAVMVPGAILTTYCAKGSIRRMLTSLGFLTERLPGPPSGKREILRATLPTSVSS